MALSFNVFFACLISPKFKNFFTHFYVPTYLLIYWQTAETQEGAPSSQEMARQITACKMANCFYTLVSVLIKQTKYSM